MAACCTFSAMFFHEIHCQTSCSVVEAMTLGYKSKALQTHCGSKNLHASLIIGAQIIQILPVLT
jgi:hypothetical protein